MGKTLIMTVGLPRSGKSTWSRAQSHPVVNPDSIRLALHGQPFEPEAEAMVWTIARYMVKSLFLAGHDTVILDATNLRESRRTEWASDNWTCQYQVFNTPWGVCLNRVKETIESERLDEFIHVMNQMRKHAEWPE